MSQTAFYNPKVPANQSSKPISEQVMDEQSEKNKLYARLLRVTDGKAPLKEGFAPVTYESSWEYFRTHAGNPQFRPGNNLA